MPRWPTTPATWKPQDTEVTVPGIGTVTCHAAYEHSENEEGRKVWDQQSGQYMERQRTHWTVTITFDGRTITSPFSQGSYFTAPPTASDVLSSLVLDSSYGDQTFEDFCADSGYDSDSRTAECIWNACRDTELQLRRMFSAKFDTLQEWGMEQ